MAEQERLIKLTWENGVKFEMDSKLGADPYKTVVKMDEDGDIASLWGVLQKVCETSFKLTMNGIGDEMKVE